MDKFIQDLINNTPPVLKMQVSSKMKIAARIADLIKERGWSKSEFAEKVGKLPSDITKWLSGTHNFTIDTLCEIAIVLEINLYELIETNDSVALLAINNMRSSFNKQLTSLEDSLRTKTKKD